MQRRAVVGNGDRDVRDVQLAQLVRSQQRVERLVWQIHWSIVVLGIAMLFLALIGLLLGSR